MATKKISVEIDDKLAKELQTIVKKIGFANIEDLTKNYYKEVLLGVRIEEATATMRQTITKGSEDLNSLSVGLQKQK